MPFFVIERDSADGTLRVLLPSEFPERAAALETLSLAVADGSVAITGEVFIVDLSSAVPVLVMPTPPTAEPVAGGWEEPDGEVTEAEPEVSELAADAVAELELEVPGAAVTPYGDTVLSDLADALRRATSSLESEGVVAPDSIEGEDTVDLGDSEDASPAEASEPVGEDWPWANVEAYDATLPADEVAEAPTDDRPEVIIEPLDDETPVSVVAEPAGVLEMPAEEQPEIGLPDTAIEILEEPAVEESPLIVTSAIDGDDAYMPRPVILGDYDDAVEPDSTPADIITDFPQVDTLPAVSALPLETAAEDTLAGTDEADPDEAVAVEDLVASPDLAEPVAETPDTDLDAVGYVPAGELDLGEYGCDDCVYVNTCPKVGESSPAECGSFQWKPE